MLTMVKQAAAKKSSTKETEEEVFTKDELKTIVQELLDSQTADLRSIVESLQTELEETRNIATGALRRVEECEASIVKLENENESLKKELTTLENADRFKEIEDRIEDRTNRQLRNTLTFKGIADDPNETWAQTENKLVDSFKKAGVPASNAANMIERAHRGRPNKEKSGPRPIYARFFSWKDSEQIKKLKLKNIANDSNVYVDQKYGPMTTKRRNLALLERKNLKAEGTIIQGYLKFPAQLWVKYTNLDERYVKHMDFSKNDV